MAEMTLDAKMRYFDELTLQLKAAGFSVSGLSPFNEIMVEWHGQPLCKVNGNGNALYHSEDVHLSEIEAAKARVIDIASTTAEYMRLMEAAPPLKASGLSRDYRTLADFNEVVLAGHPTKYGMEFITWDWDCDHKGVSHGHYYGSYDTAKQDFAARARLIDIRKLFSDVQLSEIYRCVDETMEAAYPITKQRMEILKKVKDQIEQAVPRLDELVYVSNQQEMDAEAQWLGTSQESQMGVFQCANM